VAKVIIEVDEAELLKLIDVQVEMLTTLEKINTNLEKLMTRRGDLAKPDTST
jgi:hypothetical protein